MMSEGELEEPSPVLFHHAALEPIPYSASVPDSAARDRRYSNPGSPQARARRKVTIVGAGQVGVSIAFSLINRHTPAGTIALVDMNGEKLDGEVQDLQHANLYHNRIEILGSTEYEITKGSHLVIITAGTARKQGESRLTLLQRNIGIMKSIMQQVLEHSPDAAICIVSNPCDIMTAVAAKLAGPKVPAGRIFGSGTALDSARFRTLLARELNVTTQSMHGFIIGEHGDSSVPVWSSVRVGGVPLLHASDEGKPSDAHRQIHTDVVRSGGEVIRKKGYTNWAIGISVAHLANIVLSDENRVLPVSTCVRGLYGVEHDVYVSLPCVVGAGGVHRVMQTPLTPDEEERFLDSANAVWEVQKSVWDSL